MKSMKAISRLIEKFVCDCCDFADGAEIPREEFLKFIISQLWEITDKVEKMDIAGAYTDYNIIRDFFVTAEAIYKAGCENAETKSGIMALEGHKNNGKKIEITIKCGGETD